MAIYHFSVKAISRADGRSAIAAAAYRSGEKLIDQKQQKEQDYTRKTGVEFKKIYAPDNAKAELLDRQSLWNIVEKVENRKNSVLAREFEIAFPQELNAEQRQQLLDDLCKKIVERHNVIVDAVIHAPHTRGGSDERNYHAHILFTSRQLDKDTGEFSKNKFRDFNKEKSSETVAAWRKDFADLANHYLEKNNFDARIDHRSYADRGIDLEATLHEGSAVTAMKRKYEREQLKPVEERNPKIIMPIIAL
ncbi:MobQ family relaxase, partial [Acinetobacter sp. YH12207]